ncbi:hypothetical protein Pint_13903 [Pistacia integerrima]|uniref:Uncharacterized protein n=1 Tax=Pistacia integerrima TaxID=434235 RepID=A0ACC0Y9K6_9ROSI|nr:hypothetical protein Pint_13903 [Pistacia integerrima]
MQRVEIDIANIVDNLSPKCSPIKFPEVIIFWFNHL